MAQGTIFNIQRFTVHDGPGIRTEIFLKGCPLSCPWCSNPESQSGRAEPAVYATRCLGRAVCGACTVACPVTDCIGFDGNNVLLHIDRGRCISCMLCARACPSDAIHAFGSTLSTEEVMEIILRDRSYYEESGGGVTLSGGEVLLQAEFARSLLAACRSEGIHTCVESTLYAPRAKAEAVCALADLVIADIKMMDSARHRRYTGVGNEPILENLRRLAEAGMPMILRIPVIPGVNDDDGNLRATADFILHALKGRIEYLELLPYMQLGAEKARALGRVYAVNEPKDREAFRRRVYDMAERVRRCGISCEVR